MPSPSEPFGLTVGELREHLRHLPQDADLFVGGLRFNRLKMRGDKLVQIEFQEQVYRTQSGKLVAEDIE